MSTIPPVPSYYLQGTSVTDLNRQTLWESLSSAVRSEVIANAPPKTTSSTGSTGTTSGTGTTTTTTVAPTFISRNGGQISALPASAFEDRLDFFSAIPTAETLRAFSSIWTDASGVATQLLARDPALPVTDATRGAVFINLVLGTATTPRPANPFGSLDSGGAFVPAGAGTVAEYDAFEDAVTATRALNTRPENPFGTVGSDGLFVPGAGTQEQYDAFQDGVQATLAVTTRPANPFGSIGTGGAFVPTGTSTTAQYFAFEDALASQQREVRNLFSGSQGLLGYDANTNGRIDDESELFGFDGGQNLNNFLTTIAVGGATITGLQNDINYASTDPAGRTDFNRFMVLTGDGRSTRLNQYNLEFNNATQKYTAAQTLFQLAGRTADDLGGSSLTIRTSEGFNVALI